MVTLTFLCVHISMYGIAQPYGISTLLIHGWLEISFGQWTTVLSIFQLGYSQPFQYDEAHILYEMSTCMIYCLLSSLFHGGASVHGAMVVGSITLGKSIEILLIATNALWLV